jgi:orotidine-5'-phosphate decarboxylase
VGARIAAESVHDRLVVALDVPSLTEAVALMEQLQGLAGWFKIGAQLFTAAGPSALKEARRRGRLFLDTKVHDIPNAAAAAVRAAAEHGVELMTLHASGGIRMLRAARAAAAEGSRGVETGRLRLLAVTVLTSLEASALEEVGQRGPLLEQVQRLANLALAAGLDGVVASPLEATAIRRQAGNRLTIVTPGVRASHEAGDDQNRTASCEEAIRAGADLLVVGRPILRAPDPAQAARVLLEAIRKSLEAASR